MSKMKPLDMLFWIVAAASIFIASLLVFNSANLYKSVVLARQNLETANQLLAQAKKKQHELEVNQRALEASQVELKKDKDALLSVNSGAVNNYLQQQRQLAKLCRNSDIIAQFSLQNNIPPLQTVSRENTLTCRGVIRGG